MSVYGPCLWAGTHIVQARLFVGSATLHSQANCHNCWASVRPPIALRFLFRRYGNFRLTLAMTRRLAMPGGDQHGGSSVVGMVLHSAAELWVWKQRVPRNVLPQHNTTEPQVKGRGRELTIDAKPEQIDVPQLLHAHRQLDVRAPPQIEDRVLLLAA